MKREDPSSSDGEQIPEIEGRNGPQRLEIATSAEDLDPRERELSAAREALEGELRQARDSEVAALEQLLAVEEALKSAEAKVAHLTAERERERSRSEAERAAHADERNELERRLALRAEELQATVYRLATIESATGSMDRAIGELRAEASELRVERVRLSAQLDTLSIHNDGLARALAERNQAYGELERAGAERERAAHEKFTQLELDLERRRARVRTLEGELQASDDRLATLERDRRQTVEDLRRLSESRAWRWGHGVTRALRRMSGRPVRTGGAVEVLLARLDAPPALAPGPDPDAREEPAEGR